MSTEQAAETPARTGAEPPASRDARERAMWACRQHAAEAAAVREKTSARSREVLETKLEAVANRYWQYYEFSTGTNAKIAGKLRKERPVTALAWAGKIALAVMIAYPGHVAMGEILGYPASYALGFKAYLVTWPIVSVLLLAAELMIITGTVDFRLAGDARDYLYKGYNPGHYDRAYVYRRPDEIGTKRRLAWIFYGSAALLALADLAFNYFYMNDMTGQPLLSALAGGFFTALLVGVSVLLAHVQEYHHHQHKDTLRAHEHIEAGRGYVPVAEAVTAATAGADTDANADAGADADMPGAVPAGDPLRSSRPLLGPDPVPAPAIEAVAVDAPELELEPEPAPELEPAPEPKRPPRLLPPPTQLKALMGGSSFLLDEDNTVGRDKGNSIRIDDPSVSDFHARVVWTGRFWEVEDLGSKNGTHLRGSRLAERLPTPVTLGNTVKFGKVEFFLEPKAGVRLS